MSSRFLNIQLSARILNPSKSTLISLSNILIESKMTDIKMIYTTVDGTVLPDKEIPLKVPKILSPVEIEGKMDNLKVIHRLLEK